jgi:hypothetical protein
MMDRGSHRGGLSCVGPSSGRDGETAGIPEVDGRANRSPNGLTHSIVYAVDVDPLSDMCAGRSCVPTATNHALNHQTCLAGSPPLSQSRAMRYHCRSNRRSELAPALPRVPSEVCDARAEIAPGMGCV